MQDFAQAIREQDLSAARAIAVSCVKDAPGDPKARALLFQISAVLGEWERGEKQLEVLKTLNPGAMDFAGDYQIALAVERERERVFAGEARPACLGDPPPWLAKLIEALRLEAAGRAEAAYDLRAEAFDEAETVAGAADDAPFEWLADADQRMGPALEVIVNGAYHWAPFTAFAKLTLEPPRDLHDLVWTVGVAAFANGGEWPVMIPTRYPGSHIGAGGEPAQALARRTDWRCLHGDHYAGLGQRMLAADSGDFALLDLRGLTFQTADASADAAAES